MFLHGFGVRELGKPGKVDGDTKFMIASNTKSLTTLLLAKLVDEKRIILRTLSPVSYDKVLTVPLASFVQMEVEKRLAMR